VSAKPKPPRQESKSPLEKLPERQKNQGFAPGPALGRPRKPGKFYTKGVL
jgi:hypothetical protein